MVRAKPLQKFPVTQRFDLKLLYNLLEPRNSLNYHFYPRSLRLL